MLQSSTFLGSFDVSGDLSLGRSKLRYCWKQSFGAVPSYGFNPRWKASLGCFQPFPLIGRVRSIYLVRAREQARGDAPQITVLPPLRALQVLPNAILSPSWQKGHIMRVVTVPSEPSSCCDSPSFASAHFLPRRPAGAAQPSRSATSQSSASLLLHCGAAFRRRVKGCGLSGSV